jgi:hypothetical protein
MSHTLIRTTGAAIASAVVIGAAACGPAPTGGLGPAPGGSSSPQPTSQRTHTTSASAGQTRTPSPTATPAGTITVQAWFARGGKLFETQRAAPATRSVGRAAVRVVLAGPNSAEAGAGLVSEVPAGTGLLGLNIAGGVATVDLSSPFGTPDPAAAPAVSLRLAQLVYTLTQFATVRSVHWRISGKDVTNVAGVPVTGPQTRARYAADLPAIIVASPVIGAAVTSPVTVSGTADVFEAVVSIEILNAAGREIARTFTTASCGTGCMGSYSVAVSYSVPAAQRGIIEVFERSAKDGSPVHVQKIPVTLAP